MTAAFAPGLEHSGGSGVARRDIFANRARVAEAPGPIPRLRTIGAGVRHRIVVGHIDAVNDRSLFEHCIDNKRGTSNGTPQIIGEAENLLLIGAEACSSWRWRECRC